MTLSPFHSCQAFWEHGHKEDYHSRSGKLPGFTSTTQRVLKSQISAVAQGRAVGVFWCPHRPPKACTSLILHWYSQQHETCPGLQLWLFGQVKSKAKKLPRSAKQEKKCWHWYLLLTEGHNQEPHTKASVESLLCSGLYALCNIQNHI